MDAREEQKRSQSDWMYEIGSKFPSKRGHFSWVSSASVPPVPGEVKYIGACDAPNQAGTHITTLLRSDGVVEVRNGTAACDKMGTLVPVPGGKWRVYKNIISPWASVSVGKFETAWLRADGHIDVMAAQYGPTNFGNLWTTVEPPPGERYVAVSSGAAHADGTSVSYLLRDNGSVDRRSTSTPSPMHTSTRTTPQVKTLQPEVDATSRTVVLHKSNADTKLGIVLVSEGGNVIVKQPGAEGEAKGLQEGDAIASINGNTPSSQHDATDMLKAASGAITLQVASRAFGKYVSMSAGYYATYLVRDDGAVDALSETVWPMAKPKDEKIAGGKLVCTIPAPAGTAYVGVASQPGAGVYYAGDSSKGQSKLLSSEPKPCFLIRADGRIDYTTADGFAVATTLEPPGWADAAGRKYVGAACGHMGAGLTKGECGEPLALVVRSDGPVDVVQCRKGGGQPVVLKTIQPPEGLRYLSATAGGYLLRSDGRADLLHQSIANVPLWQFGGRVDKPIGTAHPLFGQVTQTIAPQDPAPAAGGCCSVQ